MPRLEDAFVLEAVGLGSAGVATFFADRVVFLRACPAAAVDLVVRLELREVRFFLAAINRLQTDFAVFLCGDNP